MKVEAVHYGVTSIITFFPEIPESVAHVQTRSKMSKKIYKIQGNYFDTGLCGQ